VNNAAFIALYAEHSRPLAGYFLRRTGNPETAADLVAETFAAALAGRRRFDPDRGPAVGWLYGIARHQLSSFERRGRVEEKARRRMGMERLELSDAALAAFEAAADNDALAEAMDDLPADQRHDLRARVVHGRDYADIATATGSTEPAVRQRVSRALNRLRSKEDLR
jgi:RNA polymerase sigma-70 factor (ECF subfamily)